MDALTFVYYDRQQIPTDSRQLTRDQLTKIGVSADNEHIIRLADHYCETCQTDECKYISIALENRNKTFD